MADRSSHPGVKAPKQERSRRTLERFMKSAEALLQNGTFERVPVSRLAKLARSSVGSFYGLFKSKEALLEHLLDYYQQELQADLQSKLDDPTIARMGLPQRLERFVCFYIDFFRRHRGFLRARFNWLQSHPQSWTIERQGQVKLLQTQFKKFFLGVKAEIRHPQPGLAIEFMLMAMDSITGYKILREDPSHPIYATGGDRELARELTRIIAAYLQGNYKGTP